MCKLKLSRLFCLLFALSVFLGSFGLNASAASDNLVNSNLTQWHNIEGASTVDVYGNNNVYRLNATGGSVGLFSGVVYDLPSFVAGHSYTLKFRLPSAAEIAKAYNVSFTDSQLKAYYNNAEISVGYGFVSADGNSIISPVNLFTFNSSNISRYVGTNLSTTFVAGSASGRPCVYIQLYSSDSGLHLFYFSEFVLFDNDDNSKELTGIKGFLHSIRWDLVGGTCDEEDCPHSSNVNPHLSLTQRMTSGFSSLLDNIGSKFEEGSTLNTWFNNLASDVSDLGDREEGFFSNLGDRVSGFFDKLREDTTSGFTNVGDWFSGLGEDLSNWFDGVKLKFQEVGVSITTKFQEIGDKFTEFFDKFKPRVYIDLKWVRGLVNWSTGELMLNDDKSQYVVVSDLFEVPHGTKYLLDYSNTDITKALAIHTYDLNGNFIRSDAYAKSLESFELRSGFKYRFRTQYTPGVEDLSIVNDYVMIYSDEGWINALLYNMKMGIRNLFVPDEAFITQWKADLELLLDERLGVIWDAGDFFVSLVQTISDLLTTTSDDIHYELPKMEVDLNGQTFTLWQAQQVDFSFLKKNAFFSMLYNLYKAVLNVFLGIPLLNYAKKEMDATLHN